MMKHKGSCHCGAVQFEVTLDLAQVTRCNCTICLKVHGTNSIVKPTAFELRSGEAALSSYVYRDAKAGTRFFCKHCGVHCFARGYLEVIGGDYVSVNCNTLDNVDVNQLEVVHWDGRHDNWMAGSRKTPWPIG
jgi:hypothetical protein